MTIVLPPPPRGAVVTPRLVRTGGDLTSTLGGPTQRITRVGSRYACDIQLPPLDADCAASWLACQLEAEAMGSTVSLPMPQMIPAARTMAFVTGSGNSGGNVITVDGNERPPVGAWLSVSVGGRSYLHFATAQTGTHGLQVGPLLRVTFPSGTAIEVETPLLEGYLDDPAWSVEFFRFVGNKFTITESA
ncbi:MAG TPA: hypothetical protein VGG68_00720 [Caulobacteraceae bacterium]|jgi:hypothetical protein